jgi:hypothetical protein
MEKYRPRSNGVIIIEDMMVMITLHVNQIWKVENSPENINIFYIERKNIKIRVEREYLEKNFVKAKE